MTGRLIRDPVGCQGERFDVIIIGGGIQGIAITDEWARRGQRVLLLEAGDFASETTANSSRILHGGLRYLQTLDLVRFRQSVTAQTTILRRFANTVCPLGCILPIPGTGLKRRSVMQVALGMNAVGRRLAVGRDDPLPTGAIVDFDTATALAPQLSDTPFRHALLWYDGWIISPQRLALSMLREAARLGAIALNHVEATHVETASGTVTGVSAQDTITGATLSFRAGRVIVATGLAPRPFLGRDAASSLPLPPAARAFNLVLPATSRTIETTSSLQSAAGGPSRFNAGGMLLSMHHGAHILAGTFHSAVSGRTDDSRAAETPGEADIREACHAINHAFPAIEATPGKVQDVPWSVLPARAAGDHRPTNRPLVRHAGDHGGPVGLWDVVPVKLTTAPIVARGLADRMRLQPAEAGHTGSDRAIASARVTDFRTWQEALGADDRHLADWIEKTCRDESVMYTRDLVEGRLDTMGYPGGSKAIGKALARRLGHRFPALFGANAPPIDGTGAPPDTNANLRSAQ